MEYNFVERVIREQAVIATSRDLLERLDRLTNRTDAHGIRAAMEALRTSLTALDDNIDLSRLPSAPDWQSDEYGS